MVPHRPPTRRQYDTSYDVPYLSPSEAGGALWINSHNSAANRASAMHPTRAAFRDMRPATLRPAMLPWRPASPSSLSPLLSSSKDVDDVCVHWYNSLLQVGGDGWTLGAGREQLHRYLDVFGGALGYEPGVQCSFLV